MASDEQTPETPETPDQNPAADGSPPGSQPEGASPAPPETGSVDEMAAAAMDDAEAAVDKLSKEVNTGIDEGGMELPSFDEAGELGGDAAQLAMLNDVNLQVKIELGRTRMFVEDVLRLNTNSVVELDKAAGDPVDIYINDRHIARGEVLVLDENFCVRVSEILQPVGRDDGRVATKQETGR